MKRLCLALSALAALFSISSAQTNTALSQLTVEAPAISIPEAALPSRGILGWDPAAPFSHHQRPAEISAAGAEISINNVRWGALPADGRSHRWETASVRPELLEKVYYGLKTAGTGHSLLVFVFKKGGFTNAAGETSAALTIGAEPYTRAPEGYVRANDLLGRYPIVWNLTTLENYADFTVNAAGSGVELARLAISPQAARALLEAAVARVKKAEPQTHVLYANNCTTLAVSLVNQVLPPERRLAPKAGFLINPDSAFPKKAIAAYKRLGALLPESFLIGPANYASFDITKI